MERQVSHRVDGELREQTQYYHRICVVAVVSSAFPIPLRIRFQKKGEDEVARSLALIKDLIEKLGSRFFDLLVWGLHPDPSVFSLPGGQPFPKVFFRFLRPGSKVSRPVSDRRPDEFQLRSSQ